MIARSAGANDSERYLANLADRTFLNLWAYPNLYYDKRASPGGDGKELCDLLVVCGDHVLIFSCKDIQWPKTDDGSLAWRRWYKRAIAKSVDQIRGAERWLQSYPDRIFLDPKCAQRMPLALPPLDRRITHGVVVALGSGKACREFFKGGSGSFIVTPQLRGREHTADGAMPFAIGDVDPSGPFVHVLDDTTLNILMSELDTISDFAAYLARKANGMRSGKIAGALGEEDLLAYYATHVNAEGEHDFTRPDGTTLADGESLFIQEGVFEELRTNPQYLAKKKLDRDSYLWDRLITAFTSNILAGTNVSVGMLARLDASELEPALRHMALLNRFRRRLLGAGIREAMLKGQTTDRMTRSFLAGPDEQDRETGFVFMTFKIPKFKLEGGYEQYREMRIYLLRTVALALLRRNEFLKRVVAIASEPAPVAGGPKGSSEDLILLEDVEWTPELVQELEEDQKALRIFVEGNTEERRVREIEFPNVP